MCNYIVKMANLQLWKMKYYGQTVRDSLD